VAAVEKNVRERSLYKGKALNVKFKDEDGDTLDLPDITFVDVEDAPAPIFNSVLTDKLEHDILAFITHEDLAKQLNGGTLKRGALLAGPYGCGKTLTAKYIASQAVARGWTFFYVDHPDEFYEAHLLARLFQNAVIFVEDVEAIAGHDRDREVNKLLNVLDGADSKMFNIMCIFTTNHGEKISRAMFRPGRLDIVMAVEAPDAEAAVRLAFHYSDGNIDPDSDMTDAGDKLAGKIPATIQEAVSRARRRAVLREGRLDAWITGQDLVNAANSIDTERESNQGLSPTVAEEYGAAVGQYALDAARAALNHRN
jgi:transitional endoplasmic reticulum ATPase